MALLKHLFLKNAGPPWRYVELILCRDVYHCKPSELAGEPIRTVMEHLACIEVENQVRDKPADG